MTVDAAQTREEKSREKTYTIFILCSSTKRKDERNAAICDEKDVKNSIAAAAAAAVDALTIFFLPIVIPHVNRAHLALRVEKERKDGYEYCARRALEGSERNFSSFLLLIHVIFFRYVETDTAKPPDNDDDDDDGGAAMTTQSEKRGKMVEKKFDLECVMSSRTPKLLHFRFFLLLRLAEGWRRELSVLMRRARTQQTRQISYMCAARSFGQFELMALCCDDGRENVGKKGTTHLVKTGSCDPIT